MIRGSQKLRPAAKKLIACLGLIAMPTVAAGLDYATAKSLADTGPHDDTYLHRWDEANNSQHLDEKGDCYLKSPGPLRQVLVIDAGGEVTDVIADRNNAKSACFRGNYLHAHFPRPPSAPYYQYLYMADPQVPTAPAIPEQ